MPGAGAGTITNYRSENVVVARNTHMGSGLHPDLNDPLQFGVLLILIYATNPVDSVRSDSVGEPMFNSTDAAMNSNANRICVGGNTNGTFASMNLAEQSASRQVPFFRPAAPFAPFDCTTLNGGPIADVVLP